MIPRITLPPVSADGLAKRLNSIASANRFIPDRDAREMANAAATALRAHLNRRSLHRLRRFAQGLGEPFLVVEGLPTQGQLPATPVRGLVDESLVGFSDLLHLSIHELMGAVPIAYTIENGGHLFRNVVADPDAAGEASSHGFDVPLDLHTDNVVLDFEGQRARRSPIPRFLTLMGLRNNDADGQPIPTHVLPFAGVLSSLTPGTLASLRRRDFRINPAASNETLPIRGALLSGDWLRFNASLIEGLTRSARVALRELQHVLEYSRRDLRSINVMPGMILLLDNYRAAHSRAAFDPGPLPRSRWLRRLFGARNSFDQFLVDPRHVPHLVGTETCQQLAEVVS